MKWHNALKFEMDSTYDNKIWTLFNLLEGIKPIEYKWVFKRKTNMKNKVVNIGSKRL